WIWLAGMRCDELPAEASPEFIHKSRRYQIIVTQRNDVARHVVRISGSPSDLAPRKSWTGPWQAIVIVRSRIVEPFEEQVVLFAYLMIELQRDLCWIVTTAHPVYKVIANFVITCGSGRTSNKRIVVVRQGKRFNVIHRR